MIGLLCHMSPLIICKYLEFIRTRNFNANSSSISKSIIASLLKFKQSSKSQTIIVSSLEFTEERQRAIFTPTTLNYNNLSLCPSHLYTDSCRWDEGNALPMSIFLSPNVNQQMGYSVAIFGCDIQKHLLSRGISKRPQSRTFHNNILQNNSN